MQEKNIEDVRATEGVAEENMWNDRTRRLIGTEGVDLLAKARVLVVGVGGVGGYAAEMLARSGVGHLTLVDSDCVDISNLNRQLIATRDSVGESKVELFARRFRDINPAIEVTPRMEYLTVDGIDALLSPGYDYVIDAIDTVAPKVALLAYCLTHKIPVITSMGAGGRFDPTQVGYFDLWETREDGLARAVRQRLKRQGLHRRLLTVASTERPVHSSVIELNQENKRSSYGTLATIPAIFGIMLASRVIRDLLKQPSK